MAVFQRPANCSFCLIGSTLLSIAERLLPSGSSSRVRRVNSSRGCSVTHLDLGCRRRRQPPPRCAASPFRHCGTRKPSVPVDRPFSQSGFPWLPLCACAWRGRPVCAGRVSRPLGAGDGATPFQSMELGRRRFPIRTLVLPDPFLVPGGGPFIQTSVSHQSPLRSSHATLPWPACRPAPSWPWARRSLFFCARTRRGCAGRSAPRRWPPR
jgi:hypothetical protein